MRVMILESDPWIADLLKQIVLNLRPNAQVICMSSVAEARQEWQQHAADLVLADWNLPDACGVSLLQSIRKQDRNIPMVMLTGRADRASVLEARRLGVSAVISTPFQVPHVLQCLEKLLPAPAILAPAEAAEAAISAPDADADADGQIIGPVKTIEKDSKQESAFYTYLAGLPPSALELPLQQTLRDRLQESLKGDQLSLRELAASWRHDPALSVRLLSVANSSIYNPSGRPCLSLTEALQRLGAPTSLNLAFGLALRQSSALTSPLLRTQAKVQVDITERLVTRVLSLCKQCRLNPDACQSAALLHRMGELCVLYLAQGWLDSGQQVDEEQLLRAIDVFSGPFADALKARWKLPRALHELIGAAYALPATQVRCEQVLMRLANAEINDDNPASLARLRRLAGLT